VWQVFVAINPSPGGLKPMVPPQQHPQQHQQQQQFAKQPTQQTTDQVRRRFVASAQ
jgi:hypothetical protein